MKTARFIVITRCPPTCTHAHSHRSLLHRVRNLLVQSWFAAWICVGREGRERPEPTTSFVIDLVGKVEEGSLSFFPCSRGGVKISSPFSVLRTRLSNISRRELVLLGPGEEEEFFPSLMGEKSANGRKKMVGNRSSFRSRWHSISKGIWEKIFVKFYTHKTLKFYAKY